ncbi:UDP-N-acetylglucosamine--N-acetylmuramyl-(pentapeptide) pyrophosphoryl-undecaprenol N-acetylglucosamine transferase [Clostridia bacterium]|nr:UDP-N-acetylglucosamine--N-acetylmuramyl-(pentapeptide) pyrophosphoryl-undecaprenol N-acetylglucosamine transferase [Clostridia bacterium]
MPTIVLTGGGTAGHVIPHLALLPLLKKHFDKIYYVGRESGIERDLALRHGIPYRAVPTVKFARGNPLKNLSLPFKLRTGKRAALALLKELKPDVIFSKGGFVAVPVVCAAARLKIPVVSHESDFSPGLANRYTARRCKTVCASFENAAAAFGAKGVFTGAPIRPELYRGNRPAALQELNLPGKKPVLLVTGGSSGAAALNAAARGALPRLLDQYEIIHLTGKGNLSGNAQCTMHNTPLKDQSAKKFPSAGGVDAKCHRHERTGWPSNDKNTNCALCIVHCESKNYRELEFTDDMTGMLAAADVVVSRAGSNTVFELLALKKPMLLIPLPKGVSRGDQVLNADYFKRHGLARVLRQDALTPDSLVSALDGLFAERERRIAAMKAFPRIDGTERIFWEIIKAKDNLKTEN